MDLAPALVSNRMLLMVTDDTLWWMSEKSAKISGTNALPAPDTIFGRIFPLVVAPKTEGKTWLRFNCAWDGRGCQAESLGRSRPTRSALKMLVPGALGRR